MSKVKCPECKRVGTYSPKFGQCSACGRGHQLNKIEVEHVGDGEFRTKGVTPAVTEMANITPRVTESVTKTVTVTPTVTKPCPACGCTGHVAKSGAERQKAWRARKKR